MDYLPEKLTISDNLDHLPPPYCYEYDIEVDFGEKIQVKTNITYFDREELDPEEIEAEGFSVDDNFTWQGELPGTWREEMINQMNNNLTTGKNKKGLIIKSLSAGKSEDYVPRNAKTFGFFTQELIQAMYEAAGKQSSLNIHAIYNSKIPESYQLDISFYNRIATLLSGDNSVNVDWRKAQKALERLFQNDFDPFNVITKVPKREGLFINIGEGYWYEAGVGLRSVEKKDPSEEILKLFRGLAGG